MDNQEELIMEELEEGEVSDDSVNNYTPLERPENYSNLNNSSRFPKAPINESESEDQLSTEGDSDSDSVHGNQKKNKRPKIKLKPKQQLLSNKKQKYNIWSTRVQEDVLSETLNSCDVTKKDRSRDVESYDYVVSARYQNMINGGNKRTWDARKNTNVRLGKRTHDKEQQVKGKSRNILDLVTTLENSVEEIAKDIANKLYEEKEELIVKILNIVGKQKCFDLFQETQQVELNGGMLIMNLTRRRTPGGVFLYLVRCDEDITREQKNEMFNEDRKKDIKDKRKRKFEKIKKQKDEERAKLLPELLTKANALIKNRFLKEASEADVVNPPPTPETDGYENSCDDIEHPVSIGSKAVSTDKKRDPLPTYDDDFLDISCSNTEMDLF